MVYVRLSFITFPPSHFPSFLSLSFLFPFFLRHIYYSPSLSRIFRLFPFSIIPYTLLLTSLSPSLLCLSPFSIIPSFLKVSNVIFILYSLLHSFRFKKSSVTGLNFFEVSFVNGKYNPISSVTVSNRTVSF